jgi:pyrimidine nucleoside transport protein
MYRWQLYLRYLSEHGQATKIAFYVVLAVLYNAYLIYCIVRYADNDLPLEWCDELGFLIILTIITYVGLFYYQVGFDWGKQYSKYVSL